MRLAVVQHRKFRFTWTAMFGSISKNAPPEAAPYQTQINNELRRVMENDSRGNGKLENDILNDEEFLRALKENWQRFR